jgi:CRP-like cAMP-binding protein
MGESMFLADDKSGGKLEVKHNGKLIHTLHAGDTFGESSLLFRRPRQSTVTCVAKRCDLQELHSDAFYEMLEIDPTTKNLLYRMARQRTWE